MTLKVFSDLNNSAVPNRCFWHRYITHPGVACLTNKRFNQPVWNTLRFLRLSIQINCIYLLIVLIAEQFPHWSHRWRAALGPTGYSDHHINTSRVPREAFVGCEQRVPGSAAAAAVPDPPAAPAPRAGTEGGVAGGTGGMDGGKSPRRWRLLAALESPQRRQNPRATHPEDEAVAEQRVRRLRLHGGSGGGGSCRVPPALRPPPLWRLRPAPLRPRVPAGAGPPPAPTIQRPPLPSEARSDSAPDQSQRRRGALSPITVRPVGGGGCPHGRAAFVRGESGSAVTRPGLTRGPNAVVSPARSDLLGRERPRVPCARPGRRRSIPTWRVLPLRSPPGCQHCRGHGRAGEVTGEALLAWCSITCA